MHCKLITCVGVLLAGSFLLSPLGAQNKPRARNATTRQVPTLDGPTLYRTYCATCHGTDATGNGPMAGALRVAPPDLTRIAERNGGSFPMVRVQRIIAGEEALTSGHGTREMSLWGPVFSQVDRDQDLGRVRIDNLTRYLMGLQTRAAAAVRDR